MGKINSLNGYRAEKAFALLIEDIVEVRNVEDWASRACMSPDWLRKTIRKKYNKSPKQLLREVRYEKIVSLIEKRGWRSCGDEIAIDSGTGQNCKALHKFLSRHYDVTITDLREELLTGKRIVDYVWLNNDLNE